MADRYDDVAGGCPTDEELVKAGLVKVPGNRGTDPVWKVPMTDEAKKKLGIKT